MNIESRFVQAHREARYGIWLTLAYLSALVITAWISGNAPGITGLPRWFELSCLFTPLFFIFLCCLMLYFGFQTVSLEETEPQENKNETSKIR